MFIFILFLFLFFLFFLFLFYCFFYIYVWIFFLSVQMKIVCKTLSVYLLAVYVSMVSSSSSITFLLTLYVLGCLLWPLIYFLCQHYFIIALQVVGYFCYYIVHGYFIVVIVVVIVPSESSQVLLLLLDDGVSK